MLAKIRPKLFNHVSNRIPTHLRAPHSRHVSKSSLTLRVIAVCRNRCRGQSAAEFGIVELFLARIRTRDKYAAHCMLGSSPEPAVPELIVAGILVEHGRKHCTGHEVLDGIVGIGGSVSLRISLHPLPVRWITVARLVDARD